MPLRIGLLSVCSALLVALTCLLVHSAPDVAIAQGAGKRKDAAKEKSIAPVIGVAPVVYGTDKLPAAVVDMHEAILAAVRSGRIEDLKVAVQMNELKPDLGGGREDPIGHLRKLSGDGEGREVLAALGEILDAGYATLPLGRDVENNKLLVWPYFAVVPLDKLTPGQHVELLRLVPPLAAKAMIEAKRYTWWRISIAADGTWHSFLKVD